MDKINSQKLVGYLHKQAVSTVNLSWNYVVRKSVLFRSILTRVFFRLIYNIHVIVIFALLRPGPKITMSHLS